MLWLSSHKSSPCTGSVMETSRSTPGMIVGGESPFTAGGPFQLNSVMPAAACSRHSNTKAEGENKTVSWCIISVELCTRGLSHCVWISPFILVIYRQLVEDQGCERHDCLEKNHGYIGLRELLPYCLTFVVLPLYRRSTLFCSSLIGPLFVPVTITGGVFITGCSEKQEHTLKVFVMMQATYCVKVGVGALTWGDNKSGVKCYHHVLHLKMKSQQKVLLIVCRRICCCLSYCL